MLRRAHPEAEVHGLPGDGGGLVAAAAVLRPVLLGLEVALVAGGHLVARGVRELLGRQHGDGGVRAVDPDQKAVVHPDVVVGEAEVVRHHPRGDEDPAVFLDGGGGVVVAVAAGDVAGVQLKEQRPPLAAGLPDDHGAVLPVAVAVEAQPAVGEDGAVHIDVLPGPEGHALVLQLQDVLIHRREVDGLGRRRGDGQQRQCRGAEQRRQDPLPRSHPSPQKAFRPTLLIL